MNSKLIIFIIAFIIILKLCSNFRTKVYKLFILAETTFIFGEKMNFVVNQIYNYLPKYIKVIANKTILKFIIQRMFNTIKDFLNDGKMNNNRNKI